MMCLWHYLPVVFLSPILILLSKVFYEHMRMCVIGKTNREINVPLFPFLAAFRHRHEKFLIAAGDLKI
jgi:hypothetical protein